MAYAGPDGKRKSRSGKKWRTAGIALLLSLFFLAAAGVLESMYNILAKTPDLDPSRLIPPASSTVLDTHGHLLGYLEKEGDRQLIHSLQQVSPHVIHAFIAAEDKDFYHHIGINPVAIVRAAMQNLETGRIFSGASTITQQTVKLAMFPDQKRTLARKLQEMALALKLERKMSKDEILVAYLNWLYFGKINGINVYGIKNAAEQFFGKDPSALNLAEASFLATIPNNPSRFSPPFHWQEALGRQRYVLRRMYEEHLISRKEEAEARSFAIEKAWIRKTAPRYGPHPYVMAEVADKAAEKLVSAGRFPTLEAARKAIYTGGYTIRTTIDRDAQNIVEKVLQDPRNYPPGPSHPSGPPAQPARNPADNMMEEAGAVLIDNETGRILAVGGGRDFERDQINHATLPRQPGSTIKPLADYGPALELHLIAPATPIDDVPTVWYDPFAKDHRYFPLNDDRRFHGFVTVRKSLQFSYNIPALKIFDWIHPATGIRFLRSMGVTTLTEADAVHLASGIGGLERGMTVEEASASYAAIPNRGIWHQGYLVDRILDRDGNPVYEHIPVTRTVFSPETSFLLTSMLRDVVAKGTAAGVGKRFPDSDIAGKTGTTNEDRDAWFIGFTPKRTLGIWVGYNIPRPLAPGENHRPQRLWTEIMRRLPQAGLDSKSRFPGPPGTLQRTEVCQISGKLPTLLCRMNGDVISDYFVRGFAPQDYCTSHVRAPYTVILGRKYVVPPDAVIPHVQEGIFIQRKPYMLPDNRPEYRPADAEKELPPPLDPQMVARLTPPAAKQETAPEGRTAVPPAPADTGQRPNSTIVTPVPPSP
jgi:membrane peptidoglycan carboxypeptidase